jgi:hypothetical protein
MSTNGGANGAIKKFSRLTMSASNGKDVIKNKIFTLIIIKKIIET